MLGRVIHIWLVLLAGTAATSGAGLPDPLLTLYERMRASTGLAQAEAGKQHLEEPRPRNADDPTWAALDSAYRALREDELDAAIEGFERAAELSPERTDIRKNLAYTYLRIGENERARRQFERVAEIDPADWNSQSELAFLDYESPLIDNKAAAWRIFRQLQQISDPEIAEVARRAFGFIDASLDARIRQWEEAIAKEPQNLFSWAQLGAALEERNEFSRAEAAYRVALGGGFSSTRYDLARVILAQGRVEDARAAFAVAAQAPDPYVREAARERLLRLGSQR